MLVPESRNSNSGASILKSVDLYIDGTNGSDTNSGTAYGSPVKTLSKLIEIVNSLIAANSVIIRMTIHLNGNINYTGDAYTIGGYMSTNEGIYPSILQLTLIFSQYSNTTLTNGWAYTGSLAFTAANIEVISYGSYTTTFNGGSYGSCLLQFSTNSLYAGLAGPVSVINMTQPGYANLYGLVFWTYWTTAISILMGNVTGASKNCIMAGSSWPVASCSVQFSPSTDTAPTNFTTQFGCTVTNVVGPSNMTVTQANIYSPSVRILNGKVLS